MRRHAYRVRFEQNFLAPACLRPDEHGRLPVGRARPRVAWATLRALDSRRTEEWLFAGLLAGVAIGVKPANAFFLVAVVGALRACTGSSAAPSSIAVGLAPALLVLALWKQRGLGHLPLFAYGQVHEAAGPSSRWTPRNYIPWNPIT